MLAFLVRAILLFAIDGWELFKSRHRHCPECLERQVTMKAKDGLTDIGVREYYHRYVVAMLILAFSKTLPMFALVAIIWGAGNAFVYPTLVLYAIDLAGPSRGPAMTPQPFGDQAALPTMLLAQYARREVTVVLTETDPAMRWGMTAVVKFE